MAQLEVYRNLAEPPVDGVPYLLDVQSDVLAALDSRVVVPLFVAGRLRRPIRHLNPQFQIEGVAVVMATQFIAGTSLRNLGELVAILADYRYEIIGAVDLLITGV